jgi:hypothetical protein
LKTVTLVLALAAFVGTTTLCVHVSTAVAATGSGGCTNGDPDSPKDTAPKQSSAQTSVVSAGVSAVSPGSTRGSIVRWMVVEQILNSLFGSPGLMR